MERAARRAPLALSATAIAAVVAMVFALLLLVGSAAAQDFPRLTGRVVDAAGLLDAAQVQQLTALSEEVEKASSRQLVVATVPDLQGYAIEDYGYRLGRAWKIGQEGANNGVILLVAPRERKVRIEVGYGLEPIVTDAYASVVVNQTVLPRFRDGDMAGGIVAGAQAIAEQLKLPLEAAERRAAAAAAKKQRRGEDAGEWMIAVFWIAVVLFLVVLPLLRRAGKGRRYRGGFAPVVIWGGGNWGGGNWGGGNWGGGNWGGSGRSSSWGGGGGFGGFSGGGGSFGGGGASGSW